MNDHRQIKNRKRIRATGIIVLLLISLLLPAFCAVPAPVAEASKKIVRVGWFESPYYISDQYGRRSGYAYEYQQKLASYTGWSYEYVDGSWPELYEMLCDGQIDLLADVSFTEERTENMLFPSFPMGEEEYYIFIDPDGKSGIDIGDLSTLNGKKVGVNKGSIQKELFLDWEKSNGIHADLVELTTDESITQKRLKSGKLDAYVSLDVYGGIADMAPLIKIGASDYYFTVSKSRPDLLKDLDSAMARINAENRFYNKDLQEKYLSSQGVSLFLSEDEKKWLAAKKKIRVGYRDDYLAYCATDKTTGKLQGALDIFLDAASDSLQNAKLEFEPVPYQTVEDALTALEKGEVDCVFPVDISIYDGERRGVMLTSPQMATEMYVVVRKRDLKQFDPARKMKVALDKNNPNYVSILMDNFTQWERIYFDTPDDCLAAVSEGKADCVLISSYRLNAVSMAMDKYNLFPVTTGVQAEASFAVKKENTQLINILNKVTNLVPESIVYSALTTYSNDDKPVSVRAFFEENLVAIICLFAAVTGGILFLLFRSMRSEKKARQSQEQTQEAFSQIAQLHETEKRQLDEITSLNSDLEAQIEALAVSREENRAKNTFLANMSHEIRTPITTILGMNEIISRDTQDEDVHKCSDNIRIAGNSLLGIISDILDFTKIEDGKMELFEEPYELKHLLGDLYNLVRFRAEKKGLKLRLDIDPHLPAGLVGDELRIKQVITNLLVNAIKYTEEGSVTLEMSLRNKTEDISVLYVAVKDTGIGIRVEERHKLFESFHRLDTNRTHTIEGIGLGLSISSELLSLMGSEISVESEYNLGSTFSFLLRQNISDPNEVGKLDENTLTQLEAAQRDRFTFVSPESHILIVDDTHMNLEVVRGLLKPTQIAIDVACSGQECIEKFSEGGYDLVFLDYRMPHMDGIETLAALKETEPQKVKETPIISLTANAVQGDREMMLEAGFDDYLTKPVKVSAMDEMLLRYLPESKVVLQESEEAEQEEDLLEGIPEAAFSYPWLDPKEGVEYCGDATMYMIAIQLFVSKIDSNTELIEKCLSEGDINLYTITVHSLKSTSLSIGMADFSERARQLELAGKREDVAYMTKETPAFLELYQKVKVDLQVLLE